MDGWQDSLHFSFIGEHVLFTELRLKSFSSFFLGSVITVVICLLERFLTLTIARHWTPCRSVGRSRLQNALWRTGLYWVVTLLRLLYMLISMTFHVGLILLMVTTLSLGQFVIEYLEQPQPPTSGRDAYRPIDSDPFYSRSPVSSFDKPRSPPTIRPRAKSKSKPSDIFIHPNYSNISRADAMAVEMGIHGDTDRVKSNAAAEDDNAWELGKGRAVARELLRGSSSSHTRTASQQMLFRIEDGESEDEQG